MGLSVPSFLLGWTSQLWLGVGSVCRAGSNVSSLTRCWSFMFSWASTPWHSPPVRRVVQGLPQPLTPPVPDCQAQREMLRGARQLPAHSGRGAGMLGWWPVVTGGCTGTEAAPLALCSPHGSVLAIHLGSPVTVPWDIFCSACFLRTSGRGLNQNFRRTWKACSANWRE